MKLTVIVLMVSTFAVCSVKATSLDVLEEQAQQEAVDYMRPRGWDVQHGPAIISGSFQKIVLQASFFENGRQKTFYRSSS